MTVITCPRFTELEKELVDEFVACFQENVEEIEHTVQALEHRVSPDLINELFRSMHSLKGNCRMVFLDPMVDVIHELEDIVSEMRNGDLAYQPMFGVFFMSIIGYVETMIGQLASDQQTDGTLQAALLEHIRKVREATPGNVNKVIDDSLDALLSGTSGAEQEDVTAPSGVPGHFVLGREDDLSFFRFLSRQIDQLSVYRKDRTQKELELCLAVNRELGDVVDPEQLEAAVLLHDFGMAFIPLKLVQKPAADLTRDEQKVMMNHVAISAQFLARLDKWQEAAMMILHHHEAYNGSGQPYALKGEEIPVGARIIALCDTFFDITSENAERSYKKSLFDAVRRINACNGSLFDPACVEAFNMAARNLYISKA